MQKPSLTRYAAAMKKNAWYNRNCRILPSIYLQLTCEFFYCLLIYISVKPCVDTPAISCRIPAPAPFQHKHPVTVKSGRQIVCYFGVTIQQQLSPE